jgi:hypothetical protein
VISPSEERLNHFWLKAMAATDSAEVESLLMEFRDALHEHIEQIRNSSETSTEGGCSTGSKGSTAVDAAQRSL